MPAPPELPTEPEALLKEALQPPAGRERERVVLPLVLLLITFGTTTLAGFLLANTIGGGTVSFAQLLADPALIVLGLPFSLTLLTILLAHEMGHYLACRYYGIRATLPYVLPAPPIPFGTFGAVIRIKSPFATPRQLFDVGVAGPLAGMVFVVPAAAIGLALSTPLAGEPPAGSDFVVSFPLLFRVFVRLFHGPGFMETVHPIACAAWFGSLATAFNLIPIGQLDGGHLTWALAGPRLHLWISRVGWVVLVTAGLLLWPGYLVFGIVLAFIGFRHPIPLEPYGRLGSARLVLAVLALASFCLTVVPVPIRIG